MEEAIQEWYKQMLVFKRFAQIMDVKNEFLVSDSFRKWREYATYAIKKASDKDAADNLRAAILLERVVKVIQYATWSPSAVRGALRGAVVLSDFLELSLWLECVGS